MGLKPPPSAPPPRNLQQTFQRPFLDPTDSLSIPPLKTTVVQTDPKPLPTLQTLQPPPIGMNKGFNIPTPGAKAGAIPMFSTQSNNNNIYDLDDFDDVEVLDSGRKSSNKADSKKRPSVVVSDTDDTDNDDFSRKVKTPKQGDRKKGSVSAWGGSFKSAITSDDEKPKNNKQKSKTDVTFVDNDNKLLSDSEVSNSAPKSRPTSTTKQSQKMGKMGASSNDLQINDVMASSDTEMDFSKVIKSTDNKNDNKKGAIGGLFKSNNNLFSKQKSKSSDMSMENIDSIEALEESEMILDTKLGRLGEFSNTPQLNQLQQLQSKNTRQHSDNHIKLSLPFPKASQLGLDIDEVRHMQGRLTIKCLEGNEIRPDTKQRDTFARAGIRIDPWLKFRLVPYSRSVAGGNDAYNSNSQNITSNAIGWKSSKMKRKQSTNPLFDDEMLIFNITDMNTFVRHNSIQNDDVEFVDEYDEEDVIIQIELWIATATADLCVGVAAISLMKCLSNPFFAHPETIPLQFPIEKSENGHVST